MLLPASAFWLLGPEIAGLYLDADEPDTHEPVRLAVTFLSIAAVFQLVDGA